MELFRKKRLNGVKSQPRQAAISLSNLSFGAPWGTSSLAARAGERVSELIAEMTVEMAMVTANCL
ncbi:hypothetical protein D3C86_1988870 [compost metagenome]